MLTALFAQANAILDSLGRAQTSLYLISWDQGENRDAIVEAESPAQAVELWRSWVASIFDLEADGSDPLEPDYVFPLPDLTGKPRVFNWHTDLPSILPEPFDAP